MSHRCHARGCQVEVVPHLLMCGRHWQMVPRALQREVWRTSRPGQEVDKQPSEAYMEAERAAIVAVAKLEGRE